MSLSFIKDDGHTEKKKFILYSSEKKECSLILFLQDSRKSLQRTEGLDVLGITEIMFLACVSLLCGLSIGKVWFCGISHKYSLEIFFFCVYSLVSNKK